MDFAKMFQTWINVVTSPSDETFSQELDQPEANFTTAFVGIMIAAVGVTIFAVISLFISMLLQSIGMIGPNMFDMSNMPSDIPPEMIAQMTMIMGAGVGFGFVFAFLNLIIVPISFVIGSGFYFLVAKLMGGQGEFEKHTYALSIYQAPLMIVSSALTAIPLLGGCLSLFVMLYHVVLTFFAIKTAHRLGDGAALFIALLPLLIGFLCVGSLLCTGLSLALVGVAAGQ